MIRYLFWTIAFYLLIRFIFNFVIPVFRATKQMKGQMREFQNRMQSDPEQPFQQKHEPSGTEVKKGDYIDFEEVK
ncbi:MAG TPA: hypothetical protein VM101_15355 [Flavitalea sp.]|nr:hypothetical protein [Flavitalea sp.]